MLNLLKSYVNSREQRVTIQSVNSEYLNVKSGVPQGSILGPLMFVLYINDLPSVLSCSTISMYADDSKFYKEIKTLEDCEDFQQDLNNVVIWCKKWFLKLNLNKCKSITFTNKRNVTDKQYILESIMLEKVKEIRDLGVLLSSSLNFNDHIDQICSKGFRMSGFIKRNCKSFKSPDTLLMLYQSLVRSQLEYCSQVWSPHTKSYTDKIERIQKSFLNFLSFNYNVIDVKSSYADKCKAFKLVRLDVRRNVLDLSFLHSIVNATINDAYLLAQLPFHAPYRKTRNTQCFKPPVCRLNIRKFSYMPRVVQTFNNLSNTTRFKHLCVQNTF